MKDCCINCKFNRDWCCSKKKMKGYVTCMNPDYKPPLEIAGTKICKKYVRDATR